MGDQVEAIYRQGHVKEPAVTGRADAMIGFLLAGTVNQNMARLFSLNRPLLLSVYPGHELLTGVPAGRQVGTARILREAWSPAVAVALRTERQRLSGARDVGYLARALSERGDPPCMNRWTDGGRPAARRRAIGSSGGMPEPAETPAVGAVREVLDEAGKVLQKPPAHTVMPAMA